MTIRTKTDLDNIWAHYDPENWKGDLLDSLGGGKWASRTAVTFESATQTLVTVPANSIITSVKVIRTTAWSAVTTFQVGKSGTTDWLVSTAQANVTGAIAGTEEGEVETIEPAKVVTTATAVVLTLNQGAAAAGVGYVIVEYTELT